MQLQQSDIDLLNTSEIGLLGFGAQGEAEAINLKRSKISFRLGIRMGGKSEDKAKKSGLDYSSISEVISRSQSLVINLSDQSQREIYETEIKGRKNIKRLIFAHGFNTHFGLIPIENDGPVHILVATKGAANGLKEFYQTPYALPAILAVRPYEKKNDEQPFAEAFARAVGAHPQALTWADFKDETVCDLFSEQALLCGGVSSLLRTAYDVMVEAGYNSETAYFESLYELKLIVDLIWKNGITGMRNKISPTARYGDITRGDFVIDASVKNRMKEVLAQIENGNFAQEFLKKIDSPEFKKALEAQSRHPIETVGANLRAKMSPSEPLENL